ncbi:hypothetical protein TNCV_1412081 [Trichonephila clavipes]|nr:hypothetical protein TNCV_1412081 [Trichonephila clavipes]
MITRGHKEHLVDEFLESENIHRIDRPTGSHPYRAEMLNLFYAGPHAYGKGRITRTRFKSSYRRINDTGPPSYRGPKMCEQSVVKCQGAPKKGLASRKSCARSSATYSPQKEKEERFPLPPPLRNDMKRGSLSPPSIRRKSKPPSFDLSRAPPTATSFYRNEWRDSF